MEGLLALENLPPAPQVRKANKCREAPNVSGYGPTAPDVSAALAAMHSADGRFADRAYSRRIRKFIGKLSFHRRHQTATYDDIKDAPKKDDAQGCKFLGTGPYQLDWQASSLA